MADVKKLIKTLILNEIKWKTESAKDAARLDEPNSLQASRFRGEGENQAC